MKDGRWEIGDFVSWAPEVFPEHCRIRGEVVEITSRAGIPPGVCVSFDDGSVGGGPHNCFVRWLEPEDG